jgi:hypothetical protein
MIPRKHVSDDVDSATEITTQYVAENSALTPSGPLGAE